MKRISLLLIGAVLAISLNAQVFNTGRTLKKGALSLGIEPVLHFGGDSRFMLFAHGGYGLTQGIDLGVKAGAGSTPYFGADLEWALAKYVSLTTGAHHYGDFGLDGCLNLAIPLRSAAWLYSGFDMDLNFGSSITTPMWIPVGVEIAIAKRTAFILETEIGLTSSTYHVLGGGLIFYFR